LPTGLKRVKEEVGSPLSNIVSSAVKGHYLYKESNYLDHTLDCKAINLAEGEWDVQLKLQDNPLEL
jgi:hypothetical protein